MNTNCKKIEIRNLIKETSDAYSSYSTLNADYAAFASLSLPDFRRLLNAPDMTGRQFRRMIRHAISEHNTITPGACWAGYISEYISERSNDR